MSSDQITGIPVGNEAGNTKSPILTLLTHVQGEQMLILNMKRVSFINVSYIYIVSVFVMLHVVVLPERDWSLPYCNSLVSAMSN